MMSGVKKPHTGHKLRIDLRHDMQHTHNVNEKKDKQVFRWLSQDCVVCHTYVNMQSTPTPVAVGIILGQ